MQPKDFKDLHIEALHKLDEARIAYALDNDDALQRALRHAMELLCAAASAAPDNATQASMVMSAGEIAFQLNNLDMALEFTKRALAADVAELGHRASVLIEKINKARSQNNSSIVDMKPSVLDTLIRAKGGEWKQQYPDMYLLVHIPSGDVAVSSEDDWALIQWLKEKPLNERQAYVQMHTGTLIDE